MRFRGGAQWNKRSRSERKGGYILRDRSKLPNDPRFAHAGRSPGKDVCHQCLLWSRGPHRLSVQRRNIRLLTEEKCRTDLYRRRSQCECSGDSPGIADASGGYDRHFHCIDDLWHQGHRADLRVDFVAEKRSPMSACFKSLSNDGIATGLLEPHRLFDGGRRRHDLRAGLAHTIEKMSRRKAKVKTDDLRCNFFQKFAMSTPECRNKDTGGSLGRRQGSARHNTASSAEPRHPRRPDFSRAIHGKENSH